MKKLIPSVAAIFLACSAYAQMPPGGGPMGGGPMGGGPMGGGPMGGPGAGQPGAAADPARFAQAKDLMAKRQQERIDILQKGLSCIQAAQDQPAMRQCMQQERAAMQAMRPKGAGGRRGGPPKAQ
jgi:hypothetical protein